VNVPVKTVPTVSRTRRRAATKRDLLQGAANTSKYFDQKKVSQASIGTFQTKKLEKSRM
jgi:hypothetical protein